jgi:hypothetical protein
VAVEGVKGSMILAEVTSSLNGVNWLDKGVVVMILGVILLAFWRVLQADRQIRETTIHDNTEVIAGVKEVLGESNRIMKEHADKEDSRKRVSDQCEAVKNELIGALPHCPVVADRRRRQIEAKAEGE